MWLRTRWRELAAQVRRLAAHFHNPICRNTRYSLSSAEMTSLVEVSPRAYFSLPSCSASTNSRFASRFMEALAFPMQTFSSLDAPHRSATSFVGAHLRSPLSRTHFYATASRGAAAAADVDGDLFDDGIADDYYSVLGVVRLILYPSCIFQLMRFIVIAFHMTRHEQCLMFS